MTTIAYLVHDLNDPAVARRVDLFDRAGVRLKVAGFRRRAEFPDRIGSAQTTDLGLTADGKLAQRAMAVLRNYILPARVRTVTAGCETIVARNLEMLILAQRVRRPHQRVVYECLDIHRTLLGNSRTSRAIQIIEGASLRNLDLVVASAPAFLSEYFGKRRHYQGKTLLIENKVPAFDGYPAPASAPAPGKPWVIGWFGMIRCTRSLAILQDIVTRSGGAVEVVIAGRPSASEFPDFAAQVAATPGIRFAGPYRPEDLPHLYGSVHFAWAIDYFEEGLNSAWLLPNRLYEGLANGVIPLALRSVATGQWLESHGVGVPLDDPAIDLLPLLERLDAAGYADLRSPIDALPPEAVTMSLDEAKRHAAIITGVSA